MTDLDLQGDLGASNNASNLLDSWSQSSANIVTIADFKIMLVMV